MELMCPNCQQKLTIPDQYAGQLMRCPLCNGTFTAPTLTAPPPPVFSMTPEPPPPPPPPPPSSVSNEPMRQPPPLPPLEELAPAPPPGGYSRSMKIVFSPRVIPWIPPAGMLLVFLLTFLPWLGYSNPNAWHLAFGGESAVGIRVPGDALFAVYLIFAMIALIVVIPSGLFALGLVPTPPFLQVLGPWRTVIVGGIVLLSFLFLLIRYLDFIFNSAPMTIWCKLSLRIHLVVILALLIEFWLELRRKKNLPPPRVEMHW